MTELGRDHISDPGAEDAMGADGAASGEESGYKLFDISRAVRRGDMPGAVEAGRQLAAKVLGREVAPAVARRQEQISADDYRAQVDLMGDEGGPAID